MHRYLSPLRYPGGKARLAPFLAIVMANQHPRPRTYVEPFAGGAGAGLRLLYDEQVDEIVLNDLDAGIAAFWRAAFTRTDDLVARIRKARVTIKAWHKHRCIYEAKSGDDVELGFATLFLNRTNRSGILTARPIGGLDQTGRWKIDARYHPDRLAERIRLIAKFRSRVTVCEEDGIRLARRYLRERATFLYIDPPYLNKADDLYLDTLHWGDHRKLARLLRSRGRWVLTYDDDPRVRRDLYAGLRCAVFDIAHTAAAQHVGREFAVFAPSLTLPGLAHLGRRARFLPHARSC